MEIPEVQAVIRKHMEEVSSLIRESARASHFPPATREQATWPTPEQSPKVDKSILRRLATR